jgi:hypothetical protein
MKAKLALAYLALFSAGCANPYTQVPVASTASVSTDWSELQPEKPLDWTQPVEEIRFHIDSPHQVDPDLRIIGPGGRKAVPDVELVAADGRTFPMNIHGFVNEDIFFASQARVPVTIHAIRIRNGFPIHISNIRWVGYDPARVKQ